jgi:hypothetical protein
MKNDLRYAASDCFDTFPFPRPDPGSVIPILEDIGGRLYGARARFMVDTNQGLTQTYNQLKDRDCTEPRIEELRQLHLEMDRAVLASYGWDSMQVPPYTTPTTPSEKTVLEAFQDEVIDRLFVLNAERAQEEKLAGMGKNSKRTKGTPKVGSKSKKVHSGQLSFLKEETK